MRTVHIQSGAMKNSRVVISGYGGPEVLKVVEDEAPEAGSGEVRLQVLVTGVAFADLRRGRQGRQQGQSLDWRLEQRSVPMSSQVACRWWAGVHQVGN
jgi:hypothetical protein